MVIGFVQGYEELKWGISKLNPLCNGPLEVNIVFVNFLSHDLMLSVQTLLKTCLLRQI